MIILTLFLLIVMEISLSFDNAVLNAGVLQNMSPKWQNRFITWGMPIAVFGMRLLFPILIVAFAANLSTGSVLDMVLHNPEEYAKHLSESHGNIASFGGMFLLMVFMGFLFDKEREHHWLGWAEKKLSELGLLNGVEIVVAIVVLMGIQHLIPNPAEKLSSLIYGLSGVAIYVAIQALTGLFDTEHGCENKRGLAAFLYLEVLDASCSFDGVIGAFVLTNNILMIMAGLGVGALVIRSLTLYLVRGGVLKNYIYLEHGANYGIGSLACIMLASLFYPVPEPVTGMVGMSFIGLSLLSSIRYNKLTKE